MAEYYRGFLNLAGVIDKDDIILLDQGLATRFDTRIPSIRSQLESGKSAFVTMDYSSHTLDADLDTLLARLAISFSWSTMPESISSPTRYRICDRQEEKDLEFNSGELPRLASEDRSLADRWFDDRKRPQFLVAHSHHEALRLAADPQHAAAARLYLARRGGAA